MRQALLLLATIALQAQPPSPSIALGTAINITVSQITIRTTGSPALFYVTPTSKIWRGTTGNNLSVIQPNDNVAIRYQVDSTGRAIILELTANIDHIWGRIISVAANSFDVDQNYNADPASAYRRQSRRITFNASTQFESSTAEDLRIGRGVDIIALKLTGSEAHATRIVVYEGNKPIRMPAGARVITPDGTIH